jgi:hypothetical protein
MVRLAYVRRFDDHGRIASQAVHRVANRSIDSFRAVYSAAQFVQYGFVHDSAGFGMFFAPDARTIVDPAFAAGYCFRLAHDKHRPLEVGVRFTPAGRHSDRIDISGTLWADTSKRELRDIEFEYVDLDKATRRASPGGRIAFRALPNGVVLVNEWSLRLPLFERDTQPDAFRLMRVYTTVRPQESGGIVASAHWPDYTWTAPTGTLEATLRDSAGTPLAGAVARLENTDYRASADASGTVTIQQLLPGPYALSVVDSLFADLPISVRPVLRFDAYADSTTRRGVVVGRPLAAVTDAFCQDGLDAGSSSIIVGRMRNSDGSSITDSVSVSAELLPVGVTALRTDTPTLHVAAAVRAGVFAFCGLPSQTEVFISGVRGADSTSTVKLMTPNTRQLLRRDLTMRTAGLHAAPH